MSALRVAGGALVAVAPERALSVRSSSAMAHEKGARPRCVAMFREWGTSISTYYRASPGGGAEAVGLNEHGSAVI